DVCYGGAGYDVVTSPAQKAVPVAGTDRDAEFLTAQFRKQGKPLPGRPRSNLRIFWSWKATGGWETPGSPRLAFARDPFLYKLYVAREMSPDEELKEDPCVEFLRPFLPVLEKSLFPN